MKIVSTKDEPLLVTRFRHCLRCGVREKTIEVYANCQARKKRVAAPQDYPHRPNWED